MWKDPYKPCEIETKRHDFAESGDPVFQDSWLLVAQLVIGETMMCYDSFTLRF